jgi:hypothetical protein
MIAFATHDARMISVRKLTTCFVMTIYIQEGSETRAEPKVLQWPPFQSPPQATFGHHVYLCNKESGGKEHGGNSDANAYAGSTPDWQKLQVLVTTSAILGFSAKNTFIAYNL